MLRDAAALAPGFRQGQGNGVTDWLKLPRDAQDDGAAIFREAQSQNIDPAAWLGHLIADDLIAWADDFETITGADILAGFNPWFYFGPICWIQRSIEGDPKFIRASRPGNDRVGEGSVSVTYFEYSAVAG